MFDASSLRKLKLPALVALALLIAVAGYYVLLAVKRTAYLTTSNIRLLTTIGHQFDDWVRRQEQIFRIVIESDNPDAITREWKSSARWTFGKRPLPHGALPLEVEPPTLVMDASGNMSLELNSRWGGDRFDQRIVPFDAAIFEALQRDVFDIVLLAAPDGRILKQSGQADLYLADLGTLIAPGDSAAKTGRAMDVKDLAGTNYRLFVQPCCGRVRVQNDAGRPATETTQSSSGAGRKPTPTPEASNPGRPGTGEGSGEGNAKYAAGTTRAGLVVCGLVPTGTLTERRFAVSLSTMLIIAGILLLIVVSWPFLKLALIGNRQRVRLLDVLLLGTSSLLVLSIGTLYLLDSYAYTRLKRHIDEGLQTLSEAIRLNMRREIAAAYSQLRALQSAASAENRADSRVLVDVLQRHPDPDFSFYPFFDTFSLIDSEGSQKKKWSIRPRSQSPPPISVKGREYFLRVKENQTWSLPSECNSWRRDGSCEMLLPEIERFVLESARSVTRMNTQAVLAIPNDSSKEDLPVAALAFPMISLIKPVMPPGFEFAVIEDGDNGRVIFHHDDHRNLIEQFYLETDMNRRLRSVIAARRAEFMDLRYWGQDYRAYAAPLRGLPWSLVTLYEKDLVRSVNVDWMVTTLLFLIPYMLGCVGVCLLILIWPQRRATWLWPHPRGLTTYLQLAALYIAVIIVFGAGVYVAGRDLGGRRVPDSLLILLAFAIPPLVWLLTYWRLRAARRAAPIAGDENTDPTPDARERAWAEPNKLLSLSYMGAATLFLIITAAMPTAAFFKLAHSIQVVPFIKNNQVKLVEGLTERRQRAKKEATFLSDKSKAVNLSAQGQAPATISSRRIGIGRTQLQFDDGKGNKGQIPPVDIYQQPFATSIQQLSGTVARSGGEAGSSYSAEPLPGFLEPFLPYYSEFSVERRELLHDESDDKSRSWKRAPGNRIVLTSTGYEDGALEISSVVPTFGGLPVLFKERRLGLIFVFGAIVCLALAITVFASRRVFLLDMPFWSSGSGGFAAPGQSVFVVCRREELRKAYLAGRRFKELDLGALLSPSAKPEDWDMALSAVEKTLSGEPILLDHFERGSGDGRLSAKKLWLVQQLVEIRRRRVVILSSIGPFPLQHGSLPAEAGSKADEGPSAEQRWASLLTSPSFVVIDLDPRFETDLDATSEVPGRMTRLEQTLGKGWLAWLRKLVKGWQVLFGNFSAWIKVRQYREVRRILERECVGNPYLSSIHDDLDRMIRRRGEEGLDREEILAEIEERASNYYEALWTCCSQVEKLALEHLAEDGFANYRDSKVVRRLIARGLVRRDPHLRLMNETFRRFVVSTLRRSEIAQLEQETQASAWDHFKRPFATILALVVVLFVATQKERFDATMALILGATGVLPSLLKLAGLLIGERSPLPAKPS